MTNAEFDAYIDDCNAKSVSPWVSGSAIADGLRYTVREWDKRPGLTDIIDAAIAYIAAHESPATDYSVSGTTVADIEPSPVKPTGKK